jgi:hypothetical protein
MSLFALLCLWALADISLNVQGKIMARRVPKPSGYLTLPNGLIPIRLSNTCKYLWYDYFIFLLLRKPKRMICYD